MMTTGGEDPEDDFDPELYKNKGWEPLEWTIPTAVLNRLEVFETKISFLLKKTETN